MNNKINGMSPLTWAYIGDAVYELYIRNHLIETTNLKPNKLHRESIKFVKAKAQAKILENLQEFLTEEENSTAFEAIIGYLYLTKQEERLQELLQKVIEINSI